MKTYKELQSKVVPASAKIDHIDNQYLEPSSHDKKVRSKILRPVNDFDGVKFQEITFDITNGIKKDTSKDSHTTSRGNPEIPMLGESNNTSKKAYQLKLSSDKANEWLRSNFKQNSTDYSRLYEKEPDFVITCSSKLIYALYQVGSNYVYLDWYGEPAGVSYKPMTTAQVKASLEQLSKRPLRRASFISEDTSDVINTYKEEAYDLLGELYDLLDNTSGTHQTPSVDCIKYVASNLRCARDMMLNAIVRVGPTDTVNEQEEINESFKAGRITLNDGTKVRLSAGDAKRLNRMLDSTSAKKNMAEDLMKSKKDFDSILSFARDLNEEEVFDDLDEAEGYQQWPNQKKKKFFVGPKESEWQKDVNFIRRKARNKTLTDKELTDMIEKWGERGEYFLSYVSKKAIKEDSQLDENKLQMPKTENPVKKGVIAVVSNDARNVSGKLAAKVGDIINVKYDRNITYKMKVIDMLPNNKIKVEAI